MADTSLVNCVLLAILFRNINAYDNLALNTSSSFEPSQAGSPASNGNDGDAGTCINMAPTNTANARYILQLARVRRIHEINITFPAGAVGNEGFFISISNSSVLNSGYICYRSKLNVIPSTSGTYPCVGTGDHVAVYVEQKDGAIDFDICEVAITGCPYQRYGYSCSETCNCPDECHFETGTCISHTTGCSITGRWGENCNEVCGFCKNDADCDKSTGACPAGCSAGYRTSKCTVDCVAGNFGEDCVKTCGNCKNNRCNPVTGACDSTGCNAGYLGTTCFNINTLLNNQNGRTPIVWNGLASTGTIQLNDPLLTDGNVGTCAFQNGPFLNTIGGSTSMQITLTTTRMTRELIITFYSQIGGPDISNQAGFKVLASNGASTQECFVWNSTGIPSIVQKITCVGVVRVITIINERKLLVTYPPAWGPNPGLAFCEVAATGCPAGKFGEYCEKNCICPLCDYVTGACSDIDQNCQAGFYGVNCVERCGNCLNNETCNKETGACPNGCTAGYNGTVCKDACLPGSYGENCVGVCSKGCKNNSVCNPLNGTCPNGCSAGYLGQKCLQTCENGTYGLDCLNNCSKSCRDNLCNHADGACNRCFTGYRGKFCADACQNGTYGQDCANNCSTNCRDNSCNHINGTCDRCKIGYRGEFCSYACQNGTYGQDCANNCSTNCRDNSCNHINGTCDRCKIGYRGEFCSYACQNGTYGLDCLNNCSTNCRDDSCNHINGTCDSCKIGYRGKFCSYVCSLGFYGENCAQECVSCYKRNCSHIDGTCLQTEPKNETIIVEPAYRTTLSTDDLAMLICLIIGTITLIVAIVFIVIAARAHKRLKLEAEEENEEKQSFNKDSDRKTFSSPNGQLSKDNRLEQVQGPFPSPPKPAPILSDDGGLYFGVDDLPPKTDDYYNSSAFACGVSVPDLKDRIKTGAKLIEDEFKELQKGAIHPCTIANKFENKPRNRYLTVLPYDHSIVQLTPLSGKPDTNYINGSYIDSTLEEKAYIATQGPMTSTIGDFWRMVWQTCCGKIVMLTNLKEKNKIKCAQYWPNKGSTLEFGLYKISVQAEKTHITYVQRALRLEDMTTSECRTIHHFHYTAWPDHGTPDHVQLVAFHRLVSSEVSDFIGPLIVHCSAGIGRTGTFIALDSLIKQAKLTNQVHVYNFVKHMRKDRMNMIQTADQYMYVYHTIYEALNMKSSSIKRKDFPKEYYKLEDPSSKSVKRTLTEFKTLEEMRGVFSADDLIPKPKRKGRKSQEAAILEKLQTVKIPPYADSRGFLLVQSLLPTMDVDLWNLVMSSESAVVVSVDKQSSDILGSFLPASGEIRETDGMAVSVTNSVNNEHVNATCSIVEITNRKTEQSDEIMVIRACIEGKGPKMTPSEMANLATLIDHTEKASSLTGETIVLSSDGVTSPGILSVVSYAIQDATKEKTINLFQTVRQFHIKNPEFIANQEDYDFCYQAVYEFLLTDNDYANIDKDQD